MYIAFYFKGYYLIRFSELAPLFPSFDSLSACLLYEIVPANPNASLADRNKENGSKKDFFFLVLFCLKGITFSPAYAI